MISQNLLELHTPHRHKAFKMNQSETRNEVENESHVRQYKPNGGQSSAWKKSRSLLHWLNYNLTVLPGLWIVVFSFWYISRNKQEDVTDQARSNKKQGTDNQYKSVA